MLAQAKAPLVVLSMLLAGCGAVGVEHGGAAGTATGGGTTAAVLSISGQPANQVAAGSEYSFTPSASVPGAGLVFSASNLPIWASFNTMTGTLSGVPAASDVGTYRGITISVSNGTTSASLAAFSIQVTPANSPISANLTLSWDPPTTNLDGTPVTDLAGYRVLFGRDAFVLDQSLLISDASATSFVVDGLAQGTWFFAIQALTSNGAASALSEVASGTII